MLLGQTIVTIQSAFASLRVLCCMDSVDSLTGFANSQHSAVYVLREAAFCCPKPEQSMDAILDPTLSALSIAVGMKII